MIILGIVLLLIGWLAGIPLLTTLGIILVIVGLILWFLPIGGKTRRYY
jgi:hypothetical protein